MSSNIKRNPSSNKPERDAGIFGQLMEGLLARFRLRLRLSSDASLISASPLFDAEWYRARDSALRDGGMDPALHYLVHGWLEGRDPGLHFQTNRYLAHYPDVREAKVNPLVHYLRYGAAEGRLPAWPSGPTDAELIAASELFDADWYLAQNTDVRAAGMDAAFHYLAYGGREGRSPSRHFDGTWYLAQYPDIHVDGINPLVHYLRKGAAEGRLPAPPHRPVNNPFTFLYYSDALSGARIGFSSGSNHNDIALVRRIVASYRLACQAFELGGGHGDSMWATLNARCRDIHESLVTRDAEEVADIFRFPHNSYLLYGFEALFSHAHEVARAPYEAPWYHDNLVRLAEAIGAIPMYYREAFPARDTDPDRMIDAIETKLGRRIDFPNPFPHEYGICTKRGIVSLRTTNALFQAWRLKRLASFLLGNDKPSVVEIGGGLGRTAYFADMLGIDGYTIVDLPLASAAQAYFLGVTLGPDKVLLWGEPDDGSSRAVRLIGPNALHAATITYDIAANIDSMTEMDRSHAEAYLETLGTRVRLFYSVNHEGNPFSVCELLGARAVWRSPYWMRKGYVEELAAWPKEA